MFLSKNFFGLINLEFLLNLFVIKFLTNFSVNLPKTYNETKTEKREK